MKIFIKLLVVVVLLIASRQVYAATDQEKANCLGCVETTMILSAFPNTEENYRTAFSTCKNESAPLNCQGDDIDQYFEEYLTRSTAVAPPGTQPTTPQERIQDRAQQQRVQAATIPPDPINCGGGAFCGANLAAYTTDVLNVMWVLVSALAMLKIIFGGVMYATAAGNPKKLEEAKSHISYALIGVLILMGYQLIKTVFLGT